MDSILCPICGQWVYPNTGDMGSAWSVQPGGAPLPTPALIAVLILLRHVVRIHPEWLAG